MPMRAPKVCTGCGNVARTRGGRCPACIAKYEQTRNATPARRLYQSRHWDGLRKWQLNLNPLCAACSTPNNPVAATEVDHKEPHHGDPGLFYATGNLQSLCKPCHSRKTASEDSRWGDRGANL